MATEYNAEHLSSMKNVIAKLDENEAESPKKVKTLLYGAISRATIVADLMSFIHDADLESTRRQRSCET